MSFSLYPKVIIDNILEIDTRWLRDRGVELLLLDFDNTILPYSAAQAVPGFQDWIDGVRRGGVQVMVVSNSGKPRVRKFCKSAGIEYVQSARKPGTGGLKKAALRAGAPMERVALAGDQVFTDVLAANRAGALSILVKPLLLSNPLLWLRHQLERPVIHRAKRKISEMETDNF